MTYNISKKVLENVYNSNIDKRVKYFAHKVADWETLWLFEDENGFFTDETTSGDEILSLWPFKDFAIKLYEKNEDFKSQLKEVDIHKFLDDYLPYIQENNIKIMVFPTENGGALFDADNFRNMMEEELLKYEDLDE